MNIAFPLQRTTRAESGLVFTTPSGGHLSYRTAYDCFKRVMEKPIQDLIAGLTNPDPAVSNVCAK